MILNEKKQKLPEIFLSTYISDAWERISTLKADIEGIKANYSDTSDIEEVLNDLIDAYLILVGTFQNKLKSIGSNIELVQQTEKKQVTESVMQRIQPQAQQPAQRPQVVNKQPVQPQRPVQRPVQPVQPVQPQTRAPQIDDDLDLFADAVYTPQGQNRNVQPMNENYNQAYAQQDDGYYNPYGDNGQIQIRAGLDKYDESWSAQALEGEYSVPDFPDSGFEMSQEELEELEKFKAKFRG